MSRMVAKSIAFALVALLSPFLVLSQTPSISSISPTSGGPNAFVTISGSGFGASIGTSTVTFNGVTGTATNWSDQSILVPVPSNATSGPIVVTVGGNASNGVNFSFVSTGTLSGTVTRASDGAAVSGACFACCNRAPS